MKKLTGIAALAVGLMLPATAVAKPELGLIAPSGENVLVSGDVACKTAASADVYVAVIQDGVYAYGKTSTRCSGKASVAADVATLDGARLQAGLAYTCFEARTHANGRTLSVSCAYVRLTATVVH
jgi:hypothetical protein